MKVIGIAIALVASVPASAQVASPLTSSTDPSEQAVMVDIAAALANRHPDIAVLDKLLLRLPRPTPLRGVVQTARAGILANKQDIGPAVNAVEEALRLLPDDPRPKLVASAIYTFSNSPQRAADLWLQASRASPDLARMSDRYIIQAMIGRLRDIGDMARADRISARLGEIGFGASNASDRSETALSRTREAMRERREADALANVIGIADPADLLTIYVDQRYRTLWPRIAEWAGVDLSLQQRRYLQELRSDWIASDDFTTAVPYARHLADLGAYDTIVRLFLPMFDRTGDQPRTDAEFLAPIVSRSLAQLGRYTEAVALLDKVVKTMPADDMGNALNLEGAYLTIATIQTDWPSVIAHADTFSKRAIALGDNINRSAVIQVEGWRACALQRVGRTDEARKALTEVLLHAALLPAPAMQLHLCLGAIPAARALLIARLTDESTRDWALRFVQPKRQERVAALDRLIEPQAQATRTAPDVVAAANRVGRILAQPTDAGLPSDFDPFRAPSTTPLGDGAV